MTLRRSYAKLCDVADFADPVLAGLIPEVLPGHSASRPHRKAWEYAMSASFLHDVDLLDGSARILDVGAGSDAILPWLAARATQVVAVDTYGEGPFRHREARLPVLSSFAEPATGTEWVQRLDVRTMDARRLAFPDASFDVVVSYSSIEHFGGRAGVRAAAREIGRVLRPGGCAFVVTESFVDVGLTERTLVQVAARVATGGRRCPTATLRRRATEVLTPRELLSDVVEVSGLRLLQPLDTSLSPETFANVHVFASRGGEEPAAPQPFPHVLMQTGRSLFTSVALPLWKAAA